MFYLYLGPGIGGGVLIVVIGVIVLFHNYDIYIFLVSNQALSKEKKGKGMILEFLSGFFCFFISNFVFY